MDTVFAYNTNFSTEAHTTNCNSEVNSEVWPVHYACAKPYHAGSGNRGQLFRPHKDSSAWHSPRREVSLAVIDPAVHCLVSLAAVFWMSRNAPRALRDIQKTATREPNHCRDECKSTPSSARSTVHMIVSGVCYSADIDIIFV